MNYTNPFDLEKTVSLQSQQFILTLYNSEFNKLRKAISLKESKLKIKKIPNIFKNFH